MSTNKTISIPASMGSNMISEAFGKISFSTEVKELLAALKVDILVRYNPNSDSPTIELIDRRTNEEVCTLEEFKKLSQYRRFMSDVMKEADKTVSTTKKVKMIAFLVRQAQERGFPVPERIMEQNYSKFNQLGSALEIVKGHIDIIERTIDDDWKTYIQNKLSRVTRILYSAQMETVLEPLLEKEFIDAALLDMGVPKWLYNKFLDRNFTSNLKHECKTLLFPKNNYLKSIAMTTLELNTEEFMLANKLVLSKSGGIVALSRFDFHDLYPTYDASIDEVVEAHLAKYQWVLTNPNTANEVLTLRETGKMPPVFKEATASKASGRNTRPENEAGNICRQISNMLGKIQSTWNGILNFVVPTPDPKNDFWATMYTTDQWDITPTNSIYDCIRAEGNMNHLIALRNASSQNIQRRIISIVTTVCQFPAGSPGARAIELAFAPVLNGQRYTNANVFADGSSGEHPIEDMDSLITTPLLDNHIVAAKGFLGITGAKKSRTKRTGASGVLIHSDVLEELARIKQLSFYDQVVTWLSTSFKSGNTKLMHHVGAGLVLGEVFKNRNTMFENELGDFLHEVETDDEDEED